MRNALRKPPRAAPSLLAVPNLDRLISIFMRAAGPVTLTSLELENRTTLTHGDVSVLSAFVTELGKQTPEHFLPRNPHPQQLEGAALILGETVKRAIRAKEMLKWASESCERHSIR